MSLHGRSSMYSKNGLSATNHNGFLILLLIFIWGFVESIFQEICSKVENFPILPFSLPGRGVPCNNSRKNQRPATYFWYRLAFGQWSKKMYEQTYNGRLTDEPQFGFGLDPSSGDDALIQQRPNLFQKNFYIAKIFGEVTNGQSLKFKQAILYYITRNRLS